MNASFFSVGLRCGVTCLFLGLAAPGFSQTPAEVRAAFKNLHDDNVRNNCTEAAGWLSARRDVLKDALVAELYQTDAQGRTVIMGILFDTKSFVPDNRFNRTIIAPGLAKETPEPGAYHVGDPAWKFVDEHYEAFEPDLLAFVSNRTSYRNAWIATWFFKKHNTLAKHTALYTPAVLDWLASGLNNDAKSWNAAHAARTFLLLGALGAPALEKASHAGDAQANNYARALLDALKGNHTAFGFLEGQANISRPVCGVGVSAPNWLAAAAAPYETRGTYP